MNLDIPTMDELPKDKSRHEIDILARTLWGEARGEGRLGMEAVACVILNRVARPGWWGHDIVSVCQKNRQFSCWNMDDPNRNKILAVTDKDDAFKLAQSLAWLAIDGSLADITNGATHYHTRAITPYWARGEKPCAEIGNHIFYKEP